MARTAAAALACAILASLAPKAADAGDAWIPASGAGQVDVSALQDFGDRSFPADSFTFSTSPGSKETATEVVLDGQHGLGHRLSLDYDLRYVSFTRSHRRHGVVVAQTTQGFADQHVGLDYGIRQGADFADALGLSVVAPGSSGAASAFLGGGQWAVEPSYRLGFKPGLLNLTFRVELAADVFTDGGAAQFHSEFGAGAPITRRLSIDAKLFTVRTAKLSSYNVLRDRGELFDVLSAGGGLRYRLTRRLVSTVDYEDWVAGKGIHSLQRVRLGLRLLY